MESFPYYLELMRREASVGVVVLCDASPCEEVSPITLADMPLKPDSRRNDGMRSNYAAGKLPKTCCIN